MNAHPSSGTWKHRDAPAGTDFWSPDTHQYDELLDCPKCKFGTVHVSVTSKIHEYICWDCKAISSVADVAKFNAKPKT